MQPYCLQILWVQVGEISALSAFYFLLNISKIYSVQRVAPAVVYSVHFFSLLRFFMDAGLLPLAVERITDTLKMRFFLQGY